MARVIALARTAPLLDLPRSLVIVGCSLALICAGKPLPL
jgi:hypothetical protein